MLKRTPNELRDCYDRAATCRRRAEDASDPGVATFWLEQEARWTRIARVEDVSSRISTFLGLKEGQSFSREAEEGVRSLLDIFDLACQTLGLDSSDEAQARIVARTLIQATMAGESDPDKLVLLAVNAVSH